MKKSAQALFTPVLLKCFSDMLDGGILSPFELVIKVRLVRAVLVSVLVEDMT